MERIIHKSKSFKQAEEWDISQHIGMTPDERQEVAAELRKRVYGKRAVDIRRLNATRGESSSFFRGYPGISYAAGASQSQYVIVGGEAVIYYGYARLTGMLIFSSEHQRIMP